MLRFVAYTRVSTDQQVEEGFSLEAQRDKIASYAALYHLEIVAEVEDAGLSGMKRNRPGLKQALQMLSDGLADGVIVTRLDRLTRSLAHLCDLLEMYFTKHRFISVAEQFDTTNAAGRLMLNLIASINQWERDIISERTMATLDYLKGKGVKLGHSGFGWRHTAELDEFQRKVLAIVPEEQETIDLILRLHRRGRSYNSISEELRTMGRKTMKGGRWYASTVRAIVLRGKDNG